MYKSTTLFRSLMILAVVLFCFCLAAETITDAARLIFEEKQDAVVRINIVQKTRVAYPGMSTQESESRAEGIGTFIREDGLILSSLSTIDPSNMLKQMMGGQMQDIQFDVEVEALTIILPDGTEIDGKLVLRDIDFDLAFIMPEEELPSEITYINMQDSAGTDILEELVMLNRLGREARRVPAVSILSVQAIIDRPRTFYVPSQKILDESMGNPVFNRNGKIVGFTTVRVSPLAGDMMSSMFGSAGNMGVLGVIFPAEDIMEIQEQIEAGEAEKKEE